jgi:hypothetical protein
MNRVNWKREVAVFFVIALAIWAVMFAFFLGMFLYAEYRQYGGWTASQIMEEKWGFSLIYSILFSIQAWAIGLFHMIDKHLNRRNTLRDLGLEEERMRAPSIP